MIGYLINIAYSENGVLIKLFRTISFGISSHWHEGERSIAISFGIWKLHTFLTFSIM